MSLPQNSSLVRLYNNGDDKAGKRGGVKFFVNARLARALDLKPGDQFTIGRDRHGVLELAPAEVCIQAERGGAVAVPSDPFLTVWRENGQRDKGGQFHANATCPGTRGRTTRSKQEAARIAGCHPCPICWVVQEVAR